MLHPNSEMELAKTHEIMSRYRPIAPKPSLSVPPPPAAAAAATFCLKSRPCRARKRISAGFGPAKRQRPTHSSSATAFLPILPASLHSFKTPLVEQDLLKKLQEPRILVPQPLRPVGSTITVTCIAMKEGLASSTAKKSVEEIEKELELEIMPAVVSDSNNKVRVANCSYKEMVGQPECMWLDSVVGAPENASSVKKRINGEVILEPKESLHDIPASSAGFSCVVKVEWECKGLRSFVDAPCDVIRLCCDGNKDYLFAWKIHAAQASSRTNCNE